MIQNSGPHEVRRGKTPGKWPSGCCESSHSRGISLTVLFLGAVFSYLLMDPVRLSAEGLAHGDSAPGARQAGPLTPGWLPITSLYSGGAAPLSRHQIVERLRHASAWVIVSIEQGPGAKVGKWGTAWLADGLERLLITNHHVIAPVDLSLIAVPTSQIKVLFPESRNGRPINEKETVLKDGRSYQVRVIDFDWLRDLAVLQLVSDLPPGTEPLPLARASCEQGDTVHSLGNPIGDALWVYSSSIVRQTYLKSLKIPGFKDLTRIRYQCVETQSPLNPGDSGGPVVNDNGELIAVNDSLAVFEIGTISPRSFAIDVSEVRAYLDEVRPLLHPQSAADFEHRGNRYLVQGRYSEAIADLDEALKRQSPGESRSQVLLSRARAYADKADAWQWSHPDTSWAYSWQLRRDRDQSIRDLTEALSYHPSDPELLVLRGALYLQVGNPNAARTDFQATINSAVSNPKAKSQVYFFQQLMLPEHNRARRVELLNRAISVAPQNFQYHLVRGAQLYELGQTILAFNDTKQAITLFTDESDPIKWAKMVPQIRDAFHNLAHICYQLKRPKDALESYTVAVNLSWNTRPHTVTEAKLVVHMGRELYDLLNAPEDAKKAFELAEKIAPAVTSQRSWHHEKSLYFVNRSQTKLGLSIKYHTLGPDDQWHWLPGNLTTADAVHQTIGPSESAFLAIQGQRITADRVRLFLWNDKNEAVSDRYWSQDLILCEQPYQGYVLERFTLNWP